MSQRKKDQHILGLTRSKLGELKLKVCVLQYTVLLLSLCYKHVSLESVHIIQWPYSNTFSCTEGNSKKGTCNMHVACTFSTFQAWYFMHVLVIYLKLCTLHFTSS